MDGFLLSHREQLVLKESNGEAPLYKGLCGWKFEIVEVLVTPIVIPKKRGWKDLFYFKMEDAIGLEEEVGQMKLHKFLSPVPGVTEASAPSASACSVNNAVEAAINEAATSQEDAAAQTEEEDTDSLPGVPPEPLPPSPDVAMAAGAETKPVAEAVSRNAGEVSSLWEAIHWEDFYMDKVEEVFGNEALPMLAQGRQGQPPPSGARAWVDWAGGDS